MPNSSLSTLASGPRQLVVHEALEMTFWLPSYLSSLTPMTMVMSSSVAGAEMMTFFAPASRCARALAASVKMPVDSTTTSTPRSPHGRSAGPSLTSNALILVLADDDGVLALEADVVGQPAQDRVELQQVRERRVVGEVVHRHDLDVFVLASACWVARAR